jgi:hypothetical protein
MNVEIGAEEKEYINGIFVAVWKLDEGRMLGVGV